jgi:ferredoxin-NADP reductase
MREFKVRLVSKIKRTPTVESFRFAVDEKIDFLPGQFLELVFDQADRQNRELNKYLSFSCAPGKEYIEFTKRLSSSLFSQRLRDLEINDTVTIKAPMGSCVFDDKSTKVGFITGGIGITPAISMIEYIIEKHLDIQMDLFYSNRNEDDIAFKEQLDSWQLENRNLKIYYTVTDCQPTNKTCFFGRINKDLLLQNACDIKERVLFVFGPPVMVDALYNVLLEVGCSKQNIKIEKFMGY